VVDWYKLSSVEGMEYVLELPEATASLGENLLSIRPDGPLRLTLLNTAGILLSAMKRAEWEPIAVRLVLLARTVTVGAQRRSDQVGEWLAEYQREAREIDPAQRRDQLALGPVWYKGQLATRLRPLQTFLEFHLGEHVGAGELRRRLRQTGWDYASIRVGSSSWIKVWLAPPGTERHEEDDGSEEEEE